MYDSLCHSGERTCLLVVVMQMNLLRLDGRTLELLDVVDFSGMDMLATVQLVVMYVCVVPVLTMDGTRLQIPAASSCDFTHEGSQVYNDLGASSCCQHVISSVWLHVVPCSVRR